jgi:hypothetical protein
MKGALNRPWSVAVSRVALKTAEGEDDPPRRLESDLRGWRWRRRRRANGDDTSPDPRAGALRDAEEAIDARPGQGHAEQPVRAGPQIPGAPSGDREGSRVPRPIRDREVDLARLDIDRASPASVRSHRDPHLTAGSPMRPRRGEAREEKDGRGQDERDSHVDVLP